MVLASFVTIILGLKMKEKHVVLIHVILDREY